MSNLTTRKLFRESMRGLQEMIRSLPRDVIWRLPKARTLLHPDVLGASISEDPPPQGKFFDIPPYGRQYMINDAFLADLRRHVAAMRVPRAQQRAMIELFLLHEWIHFDHNLTSNRYQDSGNAPAGLQRLDYEADSGSILWLFVLYEHHGKWADCGLDHAAWTEKLAWLVRSVLRSIEVFDADPPGYPLKEMRRERFLRHATWHFIHARARDFFPEGTTIEDFELEREPLLEIPGEDFPWDKVSESVAYPRRLKLYITSDRMYRCHADDEDFTKNLVQGVLRADTSISYEAMRQILQMHPEFTGR